MQSVAVRIIVDREERNPRICPAAENTGPLDAKLIPKKAHEKHSPASFYGDVDGKIKISNKEQADKILAAVGRCANIKW